MADPLRVSLISMPFGPVFSPSMALGLLKSIAREAGCETRVDYFNLRFAAAMGEEFYDTIALGTLSTETLVGEWVFGHCLPGAPGDRADAFLDAIARPAVRRINGGSRPAPLDEEAFIQWLLRARAAAANFVDACARDIVAHSPRVVGLTSVFQQHAASLAVAARIKALSPDAFVVVGGANCEGPMGAVVVEAMPWVDAVVCGEGEAPFREVIQALAAGRRPRATGELLLRDKRLRIAMPGEPAAAQRFEDLDALPVPDYAEFFAQRQAYGVSGTAPVQVPYETSRGCWWGEKHHCTFCGLNGKTMKFRSKSPARALAELKELAARHPGALVGVTDNILDMAYFRDFLPALARDGPGVRLFYEVKANLSIAQLRTLRAAGVECIQPGIESFSDEVLRLMDKGVTGLQNVELLRNCASTGIHPIWNLIWGFPGERPEEYRAMADMLPSLFHLTPPGSAGPLRLDRFSPLFERRAQHGVSEVEPAAAYAYIYPVTPEQRTRLAYYFTMRCDNTDDVPRYTAPLAAAVRRWKAQHAASELVYADAGGELRVWDTRPAATSPLTVLDAEESRIYRHLARARRLASAFEALPELPEERIERVVRLLVERRLVVSVDGRFLAIAVPLADYSPKPLGRRALAAVMELANRTRAAGPPALYRLETEASLEPALGP